MNKRFSRKLTEIAMKQLLYGGGYRTFIRKWYNPMRYIKGVLAIEYIPPEDIYIKQ